MNKLSDTYVREAVLSEGTEYALTKYLDPEEIRDTRTRALAKAVVQSIAMLKVRLEID